MGRWGTRKGHHSPGSEVVVKQGHPRGRKRGRAGPDVRPVGPQKWLSYPWISLKHIHLVPDAPASRVAAEKLPPYIDSLGGPRRAHLLASHEGVHRTPMREGALLLPDVQPCRSFVRTQSGTAPADAPQPLKQLSVWLSWCSATQPSC